MGLSVVDMMDARPFAELAVEDLCNYNRGGERWEHMTALGNTIVCDALLVALADPYPKHSREKVD